MVLADNLSDGVFSVYNNREDCCGATLFLSILLYSFQILCDFSGYSYIAIGTASVLGFKVMDNFHHPYLSIGVADFWRRWHISLSLWLRDYVYIPLGGNRCSLLCKYRNVIITFFVSGLWHGANWNFICWGLLHGFAQIVDSAVQKLFQKMQWEKWAKPVRILFQLLAVLLTFLFVSFCWVFFANTGLSKGWAVCRRSLSFNMADITSLRFAEKILCPNYIYPILLLFIIAGIIDYFKPGIFYRLPKAMRMISCWLLFAAIIVFGKYGPEFSTADFIYFKF